MVGDAFLTALLSAVLRFGGWAELHGFSGGGDGEICRMRLSY